MSDMPMDPLTDTLTDELTDNPLPIMPAGTCRYCGCTDGDACIVRLTPPDFRGCSWADEQHTVCDTAECLQTWCRELADALAAAGEPV